MPTSHDLEQADHSDHSVQPPCRVQLVTSRGSPSHSAPPLAAEGESQSRLRHSQVDESSSWLENLSFLVLWSHLNQSDQALHLPST